MLFIILRLGDRMNEERYNYKASELNECEIKENLKNICNEYGFNLGSSRKRNNDIFDNALRLKHFNNEQN